MKLLSTLNLFIVLSTCSAQNISKKIADSVFELDSISYLDNQAFFSPLNSILQDKQIIILGESGHGDGKTFEVKVKMIKYLQKEFGYNIVALEGGGFLDMQIMSGNLSKDSLISNSFSYSWYSLWSNAQQVQPLIKMFEEGQIDYLGIESQPVYIAMYLARYLKKTTKDYKLDILTEIEWKKLNDVSIYLNLMDSSKLKNEDIEFYIKNLNLIRSNLKVQDYNKSLDVLIMAIDNALSFVQQYEAGLYSYEGQNKGINIRDEQMAKNLIWYIDKHPQEKIIVWTANFHGSKNINQVRYNDSDSSLYSTFNLFGDYLCDKYGNKLYSIAFTSSSGEVDNIYKQDPYVINQKDSTIESELHKKNIAYGFIDFSKLRNDKTLNTKFNSTILGYDSKSGKWLNVFDGIFYIRKNEKALNINDN